MFAANSRWNQPLSKPVDWNAPGIPAGIYDDVIEGASLTTTRFLFDASMGPETVLTTNGPVIFPRWNPACVGASGEDGHADAIDVVTGIGHSFWMLRRVNGLLSCAAYSSGPMNGSGFGWGVRAIGCPAMAGIITADELLSGYIPHKLCIALGPMQLSKLMVSPATRTDTDVSGNTGTIPYGGVLGLPANFVVGGDPIVVAITVALMTYGAIAADRNGGNMTIFVDGSAQYNNRTSAIAQSLAGIRECLRLVS